MIFANRSISIRRTALRPSHATSVALTQMKPMVVTQEQFLQWRWQTMHSPPNPALLTPPSPQPLYTVQTPRVSKTNNKLATAGAAVDCQPLQNTPWSSACRSRRSRPADPPTTTAESTRPPQPREDSTRSACSRCLASYSAVREAKQASAPRRPWRRSSGLACMRAE